MFSLPSPLNNKRLPGGRKLILIITKKPNTSPASNPRGYERAGSTSTSSAKRTANPGTDSSTNRDPLRDAQRSISRRETQWIGEDLGIQPSVPIKGFLSRKEKTMRETLGSF